MARFDLRQFARSCGADLVVSPCNIGAAPRRLPHLLVVYDAMVFDQPASFDPAFGLYARRLIAYSMRRATRVLTISEYSRERLRAAVGGSTPIDVVHLPASGEWLAPRSAPGSSTVVMLGATEPHKRHVVGVEAVAALRARTGLDIQLEVIGPQGRAETEVLTALAANDPAGDWSRRLVDATSDRVRVSLDNALLLLQPSEDEGFGLPVLEAGERGVPVVHTSAGALREVMPSAGVGSLDREALTQGMARLLEPLNWAAAAAAAFERSQDFSRDRYTAEIHGLVRRTLERRQTG
jgi:glycosyltransferase involved in cell wall biosynthesis